MTDMRPSPVRSGGLARVARMFAATLVLGVAAAAHAQDAPALKARHAELRDKLAHNAFQRPLYLESVQNAGDLKGEIYAVVETPFTTAGPALQGIDHWCDILILHLNVKYCGASAKAPSTGLSLVVGRKFDQPIDDG